MTGFPQSSGNGDLRFLLHLPQNLPVGADCVGSLKLTYISKVRVSQTHRDFMRGWVPRVRLLGSGIPQAS